MIRYPPRALVSLRQCDQQVRTIDPCWHGSQSRERLSAKKAVYMSASPPTSPLDVMNRQAPLPLVAVVALLTSALVPAIVLAVLTPRTGDITHKDLWLVLRMAAFFYPFAVMFAALFGLPTFFLFRRLGILKWWSTLLAGCAIGIVAITTVTWGILAGRYLLLYAVVGGVSALVFWVIWARAACGRGGAVPHDA